MKAKSITAPHSHLSPIFGLLREIPKSLFMRPPSGQLATDEGSGKASENQGEGCGSVPLLALEPLSDLIRQTFVFASKPFPFSLGCGGAFFLSLDRLGDSVFEGAALSGLSHGSPREILDRCYLK